MGDDVVHHHGSACEMVDQAGEKMSFTEKIDVLELLVGILAEHEKKLDIITKRLEAVTKSVEERPQ